MKAVGIIPARWQSVRFPGKSLALINGKPMICRVVERAAQAKQLADVIVATDDERIKTAVEQTGAKVVMTSPDHASGTDRIAEAAQHIDCEIVVNIQGDEPLINPAMLDRLVDEMSGGAWDMATAAAPIADKGQVEDANICKVVFDSEDRAMYFSRSAIPFVRDPDFSSDTPVYWRHIGVYAYTKAFLGRFVARGPCMLEQAERLEQLRALYMGAGIKVLRTDDDGVGVDTPEDLIFAERKIKEMGLT